MSLTIDQDIHSLAAQAGVRLRAYDHPSSIDRYTVVFDDGAARLTYIGMNASPFHPQGFGQHGELERRHIGSHLGKRINISDLPQDCKRLVLQDLRCLAETKLEAA